MYLVDQLLSSHEVFCCLRAVNLLDDAFMVKKRFPIGTIWNWLCEDSPFLLSLIRFKVKWLCRGLLLHHCHHATEMHR